MFDLDLDLDLDTVTATESDDLEGFDLDDLLEDSECVTKTEAIKTLIEDQDPDLVYISKDGVNWFFKWKSQDPKKSGWTGYDKYSWLDAESILGALEKMMKADSNLLNRVVGNIDEN